MIDVQKGVVNWDAPSFQAEVLRRIGNLVSRARASRTPIIYIQHDGAEDSRLAIGSSGWNIHPAVAPVDGELIVRKRAPDSFYETSLQGELDFRGIRHLIVVGCMTQYCVDTTCRRATSLGYDVTLAGDAHTTMRDVLQVEQIIAHHNSTLNDFGNDRHVISVRKSEEISF